MNIAMKLLWKIYLVKVNELTEEEETPEFKAITQ